MPCFKGIAVSVHAEGAPLPEYSVQKQSRVSRVNTYIPVPQAHVPKDSLSNKPEPSRFAISITLLTSGIAVPYSTPKATPDKPYPRAQIVSDPSNKGADKGPHGVIGPYIPITNSENETIAAYIYFDGRPKEEVATLLRPGEETWVNSRWVQVPDSEGGGLAEREFLFREVGLERWLNGLDLDGGKDAAAKLERRRQKFEKRRSRRRTGNGDIDMSPTKKMDGTRDDVLRYGDSEGAPVEKLSDDDDISDWSSDDDAPPEAAGQIKVAMFRVLASGEIKRGEYSPQFDAHDDDEGSEGANKDANGGSSEADIDHTTSFAKPKTLDPKSISTQTVTGIDGPDKPYAVFTFFYRGERQLQKMGILDSSKHAKTTPAAAKRGSTQMDFSNLGPLKPGGTVGFSAFRDTEESARKAKARKASNGSILEDSDDDDDDIDIVGKMEEADDKDVKAMLSPEDAKYSGELAEGVGRIKLKRQHSADPMGGARQSPVSTGTPSGTVTPPVAEAPTATPAMNITNNMFGKTTLPDDSVIGSPLKKQRATTFSATPEEAKTLLNSAGVPLPSGNILSLAEAAHANTAPAPPLPTVNFPKTEPEDEEL
ncbi:hypothetical protein V490_07828 [Pseudogymnoascus sp. VKM F-3557]|nr:hypothetical protein V490_07828 [Pseudogymnoascus sp. VKM F-3557]